MIYLHQFIMKHRAHIAGIAVHLVALKSITLAT